MEKNTTKTEVREKIQELLKTLKAEQEKKPLRLVEQLGYLMYVRLFIESQKRVSLQESFPFAGFPCERYACETFGAATGVGRIYGIGSCLYVWIFFSPVFQSCIQGCNGMYAYGI